MEALSQLDDTLREAAATKVVPGVVAVAWDANGTIFEAAHGVRDLSTGVPMTLDTVVWIASMTKAITSVAALQLVEQDKLSLDAPIGPLLPQLASPQVLEGFDEAGAPRLRPAKRPVTLRHLLTHTAGLSYNMWSNDICRYLEHHSLPGVISCQNVALTTPLLFDPGDRWEYGVNIDFVGKAVEAASGKSLGEYLRANVLGPLDMTDTAFRLGPSQRARLARVHSRGADGALTPIDLEVPQDPEFEMGGGGLYGTAPDYLRFARMILNGGTLDDVRILRSQTVAEMSRNQIGEINVQTMRTAMPQVTNDANFFPDMVQKWGLGFLINTETSPAGRAAGSLAWAGLANTYYWIDPAAGVCGVVLTQILPFADKHALDLLWALERGVTAKAMAA